jgi:hypothetical protein
MFVKKRKRRKFDEDGKRRKGDWGLEEKKPRVVGHSEQGLRANHKRVKLR